MGLDRQRQRYITLTVNSNTVVLGLGYMKNKQTKVRLVRMAEKGSKTILHRGFT